MGDWSDFPAHVWLHLPVALALLGLGSLLRFAIPRRARLPLLVVVVVAFHVWNYTGEGPSGVPHNVARDLGILLGYAAFAGARAGVRKLHRGKAVRAAGA